MTRDALECVVVGQLVRQDVCIKSETKVFDFLSLGVFTVPLAMHTESHCDVEGSTGNRDAEPTLRCTPEIKAPDLWIFNRGKQ